jgi:hypothetical protein
VCLLLNGTLAVVDNCHTDWHHNRRAVLVIPTVCTNVGVNSPDKPKNTPVTSACAFTASGTWSGWCGLAGGQRTKHYWDGTQIITVDFHTEYIGGMEVSSGHWHKANDQHGKAFGRGFVIPPMPPSGQSCLTKTAVTFSVVADLTLVSDPLL